MPLLIRGHHSFDHSFTQIPNDWVRDNNLSLKARGLLALLLSHAEGWSLSMRTLADENKEGLYALREAIMELERFGYLTREQKNENGRFGEAIWTTRDPEPLCDFPPTENPLYKNTKVKKTIKNTKDDLSELFLEFWNEYPQKKDKGSAFKAFRSALNRAKFEEILAGAIRYKNDPTRDPKFTKYPATWLNADSWENDYQSPDDTAQKKRELEKQRSKEFLAEMEEIAKQSGPLTPELKKKLGL